MGRGRRQPARAVGALFLAVALVGATLAGCSASAAPSPIGTVTNGRPVAPVTAAQISSILATTMAENNKANESLNLSLLKSYESGTALSIDAASYAESKSVTSGTCSFLPFGVRLQQAIAAAGSSYPERFLVVGSIYPIKTAAHCSSGACPDAGTLLEFERAGASQPWRITLEPATGSGKFVGLAEDGVTAVPLAPAEEVAGKATPGRVVAALEAYQSTGALGDLQAQYFTGSCWALPDLRKEYLLQRKGGITQHETFQPANDLVQYPVAGGGAIAVFTLDYETLLLPVVKGSSVEWISDPNADPASALLPSGQYVRITQHGDLQVAVRTLKGNRFVVLGAYAGLTSVTGVRAKQSPPSGGGGGGVLVSHLGRLEASGGTG